MINYDDAPTDHTFVWLGELDPTHLQDNVVSASHRLADAAKVGDWSIVFNILDDPNHRVDINWWRARRHRMVHGLASGCLARSTSGSCRQTHQAGCPAFADRFPRTYGLRHPL